MTIEEQIRKAVEASKPNAKVEAFVLLEVPSVGLKVSIEGEIEIEWFWSVSIKMVKIDWQEKILSEQNLIYWRTSANRRIMFKFTDLSEKDKDFNAEDYLLTFKQFFEKRRTNKKNYVFDLRSAEAYHLASVHKPPFV